MLWVVHSALWRGSRGDVKVVAMQREWPGGALCGSGWMS